MVDEILTAVLGENYRRSRFPCPPNTTYAVWLDDIDTDGADNRPPSIFTHDVSIELYEYRPDDAVEDALEAEMSSRGLKWSKQERYWIKSEQLYQVVYEFSYTEKRSE